jgi:MYXO-CTERM domain-containing protein
MAHDHSAHSSHPILPGFGADRAAHYDSQAAISLAGCDAMYELGVSALATQLDGQAATSGHESFHRSEPSGGLAGLGLLALLGLRRRRR